MKKRGAILAVVLALALAGTGFAAQQGQQQGDQQSGKINVNNLIKADSIKGMHVYDKNSKDVGQIDQVMINPKTGKAELLILSYGGFLDIGEKQVAIPYQAFALNERGALTLNVTEQQLKDAPKYNPNIQTDSNYGGRVYGYWGYPYDTLAWNNSWGWGQGYSYGRDEDTKMAKPGALGGTSSQQGTTWTGRIDKAGQDFVFVVDGRTYKLEGQKEQLSKLVGQQAKVTGILSGDTVTAQNVQPAQQGSMGGSSSQQ